MGETTVRTIIAAAIVTLILAAFCPPIAAQSARPTFLFMLEGKGVPTGTIHVFSVNSSTGAITEVAGSPFNAGLIPNQLVVDPTGRFVYVTNEQSEDITAFSVDPSSGALTELPGSPFPIGGGPVTSADDPTGRFFYVFATNIMNGALWEFLYEFTIDDVTGVLTPASLPPAAWAFGQGPFITSMAFNPEGNFAYMGQDAPGNVGASTLVGSVDFSSGTITQIGSVQPANNGEVSDLAVSPIGSFLFSINAVFSEANVFAIGPPGGALAEITGSPYSIPYGPSSLIVHPSGNFLYIANTNSSFVAPPPTGPVTGSIYAFGINSVTGALTPVSGSPFALGIVPESIVVDPTGNFAYVAATTNTTGTPFAQIMGFSMSASTGIPAQLSGAIWTDSQISNGSQLAVSGGAMAANPAPMISSISPSSATATATPFTLQVNGANFVPGAAVYFGGQARSTTFVNSMQLNASILGGDIDNDGTAVVFVFNPLPGGGASTSIEFPVSALLPVISSISPSSVIASGAGIGLTVIGSNFVTSSVVNFNGTALATAYENPAVLLATVPGADIVAQGTASISVTTASNGVPGGGTSNTVTLTISPAIPPLSVSSTSPASATAGGPAFVLTVNGTGFVPVSQGTPGSQVSFNLSNVPTTVISATQLTAQVSASAIAIAGNPYVIVTNPNGFASPPVTFTVTPALGSIIPPSLPAGSSALTLNVTGTGFAPGSVVLVNGVPRTTTYESSTLLQAVLLTTDLSQGGTLNIAVMNPSPGGTSGAVSFTVADYTLTPPTSTPPVTAGQTAMFALTVSSSHGTFSDPVTFSTSALPAGATPSFSPSATVTPGPAPLTVMLSVTTTPHSETSASNHPSGFHPGMPLLWLVSIPFALFWLWVWNFEGRIRLLAPQLLLALSLLAGGSLLACGAVGAGNPISPQVNPVTGTPAGTYQIVITATSGGVAHSTTVTLTVM
jgi:6-phosphogluconolactonase (cycloisomerase 2 family)